MFRPLQTESQEMECQMKKNFQISLAWAERELLLSYSISEPMELQNRPRLRPSAHSREIEKDYFFIWDSIYRDSVCINS